MDEEIDQQIETTSNTAPTASNRAPTASNTAPTPLKYVKTSKIVYNERERDRKRKRKKKLRDQCLETDRIQQQLQREYSNNDKENTATTAKR